MSMSGAGINAAGRANGPDQLQQQTYQARTLESLRKIQETGLKMARRNQVNLKLIQEPVNPSLVHRAQFAPTPGGNLNNTHIAELRSVGEQLRQQNDNIWKQQNIEGAAKKLGVQLGQLTIGGSSSSSWPPEIQPRRIRNLYFVVEDQLKENQEYQMLLRERDDAALGQQWNSEIIKQAQWKGFGAQVQEGSNDNDTNTLEHMMGIQQQFSTQFNNCQQMIEQYETAAMQQKLREKGILITYAQECENIPVIDIHNPVVLADFKFNMCTILQGDKNKALNQEIGQMLSSPDFQKFLLDDNQFFTGPWTFYKKLTDRKEKWFNNCYCLVDLPSNQSQIRLEHNIAFQNKFIFTYSDDDELRNLKTHKNNNDNVELIAVINVVFDKSGGSELPARMIAVMKRCIPVALVTAFGDPDWTLHFSKSSLVRDWRFFFLTEWFYLLQKSIILDVKPCNFAIGVSNEGRATLKVCDMGPDCVVDPQEVVNYIKQQGVANIDAFYNGTNGTENPPVLLPFLRQGGELMPSKNFDTWTFQDYCDEFTDRMLAWYCWMFINTPFPWGFFFGIMKPINTWYKQQLDNERNKIAGSEEEKQKRVDQLKIHVRKINQNYVLGSFLIKRAELEKEQQLKNNNSLSSHSQQCGANNNNNNNNNQQSQQKESNNEQNEKQYSFADFVKSSFPLQYQLLCLFYSSNPSFDEFKDKKMKNLHPDQYDWEPLIREVLNMIMPDWRQANRQLRLQRLENQIQQFTQRNQERIQNLKNNFGQDKLPPWVQQWTQIIGQYDKQTQVKKQKLEFAKPQQQQNQQQQWQQIGRLTGQRIKEEGSWGICHRDLIYAMINQYQDGDVDVEEQEVVFTVDGRDLNMQERLAQNQKKFSADLVEPLLMSDEILIDDSVFFGGQDEEFEGGAEQHDIDQVCQQLGLGIPRSELASNDTKTGFKLRKCRYKKQLVQHLSAFYSPLELGRVNDQQKWCDVAWVTLAQYTKQKDLTKLTRLQNHKYHMQILHSTFYYDDKDQEWYMNLHSKAAKFDFVRIEPKESGKQYSLYDGRGGNAREKLKRDGLGWVQLQPAQAKLLTMYAALVHGGFEKWGHYDLSSTHGWVVKIFPGEERIKPWLVEQDGGRPWMGMDKIEAWANWWGPF